jgi:hypothetical protein
LGKKQHRKSNAYAEHLAEVVQPHPSEKLTRRGRSTYPTSRGPYQLEPLINRLKRTEIQEVMNSLNHKKSSGYDLITGKIFKVFLLYGITYLTQLFNAVLLKGYFTTQWKVA